MARDSPTPESQPVITTVFPNGRNFLVSTDLMKHTKIRITTASIVTSTYIVRRAYEIQMNFSSETASKQIKNNWMPGYI